MKCINCNNEIPDLSTVCPICNSKVVPVNGVEQPIGVPTDTSVLPTVPETAALPIDQTASANQGVMEQADGNLEVPKLDDNSNQVGVYAEQVADVAPSSLSDSETLQTDSLDGSQNFVQNDAVTQSTDLPDANMLEESQENATDSQITNNIQPEQNTTLVNDINPEFINPNGDAVKLDNTKVPKENKSKKNLIIILAIVGVLLVISILGFLYYSSQYRSSDKRIEAIVTALTKSSRSINNDVIDKTSGSYDIDLQVSYSDSNILAKANGTYATDLSGKAIDFTFNLNSLNIGEELIDTPINLEVYLNESRAYVLFQNFYENYIYQDVEGLQTIFEANEQNNIDYMSMISALKVAFASGIKGMNNTQTVGSATIHGNTKKSNIIKINFNEKNQAIFYKRFFNSLANNKKFVSEGAKLTNKTEEDFKDSLLKSAEDTKATDAANIEIYTSMFKDELFGIKISSSTDSGLAVIELYPTANGYGVSSKVGSQNVFEGSLSKTTKTTSTTKESSTTVEFSIYINNQAYKVAATLDNVRDVNPKDAHVNVKNSINKKYLTEEDKQRIITDSASVGKIGLYLPSVLSSYLYEGVMVEEPQVPSVTDENCLSVSNCVDSGVEGYLTCINTVTNESVNCPIN